MEKTVTTNGMIIYKHEIKLLEKQELRIPYPYRFLSFQTQGDKICVWFAVNNHPSSDCYREIELMIVGTGHVVNQGGGYGKVPEYLGTAQLDGFVWHLFQNKTLEEFCHDN